MKSYLIKVVQEYDYTTGVWVYGCIGVWVCGCNVCKGVLVSAFIRYYIRC
jgi:hypothetical protein